MFRVFIRRSVLVSKHKSGRFFRSMATKPIVDCLFWKGSNTACFVVADPIEKKCAVIDSCIDFDGPSGSVWYAHAQSVVDFIKEKGYENQWVLETHVHADHITAAPFLKKEVGGKIAIGKKITKVQEHFSKVFNLTNFPCDGSQFDHLWEDNEKFKIGSIECSIIHTPGHTPDSVTYVIGDAIFTGDTAFMPYFGTARCDFPNGSVSDLYASIKKLYELPDTTRWFVGHDYPSDNTSFTWETSVGEQKERNLHLKKETPEAEFCELRSKKDATLKPPQLLFPSIQVNMNAGVFIQEDNGNTYLKTPITFK